MSDDALISAYEGVELEPRGAELGPAELVELWLAGQPSPNTQRTYRAALRAFAGSCRASVEAAVAGLLQGKGQAHALVSAYRARMLELDLSSSTINLRLAALRSLVSKAEELGIVDFTLRTKGVRQVKYRDTRGPGRAGFIRLLSSASNSRDKAIVWLLYGLALRRSEVVSLDLQHVDIEGSQLSILGKARRERELVTLPRGIVSTLRSYIEERGSNDGPLFYNRDHGHVTARLTASGLYDLLRRLGKRSGVRRCHPHGLRHASITEALRVSKGNTHAVQQFARHTDPKTTAIYHDNLEDKAGQVADLVVADAALEIPPSS